MKAVIHIGTRKTGTTTIQHFLAKNRVALKTQGILVPTSNSSCSGKHFELARVADQNKQRDKYRHEIKVNGCEDDLVILSEEGLSSFTGKEVKNFKEWLDSLFDDITIILYLRRQPEYLVSLYHARLRLGLAKKIFDYLDTPEAPSVALAYHKILESWSIFEKIKIRIFDRRGFRDNDLLSDFSHTVGFNMAGLERTKDRNISLGSAEAEFLRLLNAHEFDFRIHNGTNRRWIPDILNQDRRRKQDVRDEKAYYLNRAEAQRILDQFREGNNWIAREYLGREKLFDEDVSMYPEETVPHHLTVERSVEICAQLLKFKNKTQGLHVTIPPHKVTKFHYNLYRLLSNITFGKLRKKYKAKRRALKQLLKNKVT